MAQLNLEPIAVVRLEPTIESFGAVTGFLAMRAPFSGFDLGTFARSIRAQLKSGHNLAAVADGRLVGYAGWLLTSDEIADAWVAGRGQLRELAGPEATAAVLTTVAVADPRSTLLLIRGARELNPGKRAYFRRETRGERRKNSVLIFSETE